MAEIHFSVDELPFSYHGSWLNVSRIVAPHKLAENLHLVSHRRPMHLENRPELAGNAVLEFIPSRNGKPLPVEARGTPAALTATAINGAVELAFDGPTGLRARGTRLDLALRARTPGSPDGEVAIDSVAAAHVFRDHTSGYRFRVTPLCGTVSELPPSDDGRSGLLVTGTDSCWEIAIEELTSTTPPYRLERSFDELCAATGQTFTAYCDAIAPWRDERTPGAARAAYTLWSATVAASGLLQRDAILMSKHWMDLVWSWDHCFNALALAPGLPDAALDQFEVLFDHQDPVTGALPDAIGQAWCAWLFVKPPVHGWALGRLLADLPRLDDASARRIYDRLAALTDFWLTNRRAPGHRLPFYEHGNDSGWDNSTAFDRSRVVEAADVAAYLVLQLDVLVELSERVGADRHDHWDAERTTLLEAMLDELWDGRRFVARGVADGLPDGQASMLSLMALLVSDRLPDEVRDSLVEAVSAYLTPVGPATEPPTSARYEPDGYWRGPVWGPSTLLLESGLRIAGATELADQVSERFRATCERSGFAETFDALTGTGLRDLAYTWTASCYLVLAREYHQRNSNA